MVARNFAFSKMRQFKSENKERFLSIPADGYRNLSAWP